MVIEQEGNHERATKSGHSLKFRVFRAGGWVLIGFIVGQAFRLVGNLILTRLLTPDAFGIMAMAMVVQGIISLCSDIGLQQTIIQSRNAGNPSFLNTAWTLSIFRNFLIWSTCAIIALGLHFAGLWGWLPLGSVYANPILPAVIAVTSLSAIIQGFQSLNICFANRILDMKRITLIDLYSQFCGISLMIFFGWLTHSVWSLVVSNLVVTAVTTILTHLWLQGPRSRIEWDWNVLHELFHFGKWIWLSSAINILATSSDRLLLGGWIGATGLGYYSIANNLASVLDGIGARLFSSVSLPTMSEVARSQPDRVPELFFRMRWAADAAYVGSAGFLFGSAQGIIGLLYDARYAPAGQMLQWLSFGLLFTRYGLAMNTYIALGRPNYLSVINLTKLVSLFSLVPALFYLFGVQGAILGIAFHMAPSTLLVFWFNQKLGLNNIRLELAVLVMWPLGWLAGSFVGALL